MAEHSKQDKEAREALAEELQQAVAPLIACWPHLCPDSEISTAYKNLLEQETKGTAETMTWAVRSTEAMADCLDQRKAALDFVDALREQLEQALGQPLPGGRSADASFETEISLTLVPQTVRPIVVTMDRYKGLAAAIYE